MSATKNKPNKIRVVLSNNPRRNKVMAVLYGDKVLDFEQRTVEEYYRDDYDRMYKENRKASDYDIAWVRPGQRKFWHRT